jgi:hypothetical protein
MPELQTVETRMESWFSTTRPTGHGAIPPGATRGVTVPVARSTWRRPS